MSKSISLILVMLLVMAVVFGGGFFFMFGFAKIGGVVITDYTVAEDGLSMDIKIEVTGSDNGVRKAKPEKIENGDLKLVFLSTFGGSFGKFGEQTEFTIPLDPDVKSISIRSNGQYVNSLYKDADGEWQKY